ncbi:MAG: FG-GAP-like repeat-containing protein [Salinibacter sp.]
MNSDSVRQAQKGKITAPLAASAEDLQFGAQQTITTEANEAWAVYASDLDGDGDQDVLSASYGDDKIAWYENNGAGVFSTQKVVTANADGAFDVYATDLDGDGDKDILSASGLDDKIAWYENNGTGSFSDQRVITEEADGAFSVHAADLDGDGDKDVAAASWEGDKITWYENIDGDGLFSDQKLIADDFEKAEDVYAVDLDGDGDRDILTTAEGEDVVAWHENDGSGSFSSQKVITSEIDGGERVHAEDIDGDGDQDVLSASYGDGKIAWYENIGSGNFSSQKIITTNAVGATSVYAEDVDGDGDSDVFSASRIDDKVAWYENDGSGVFSNQKVITRNAEGSNEVYLSDLDGDSDRDVLSSSSSDNKVAWYKNTGYLEAPFTDNFNDAFIDSRKWETTGRDGPNGDRVVEEDGVMKVEVRETDNGGILNSKWIRVGTDTPIQISQETKVHYANDKFSGDLRVHIEGKPAQTFGVSYANYDYDGGQAESLFGIHLFRNAANPNNECCQDDVSEGIDGIWDQWFNEDLVYNPQTGELRYLVADTTAITYNVGSITEQDSINVRLEYQSWGWWTGHYIHLDDLSLTQGSGGVFPPSPSGLVAAAEQQQVDLTWEASTSEVDGYNVYRSTSSFGDPSDATKLNASPLSDASYTDADVSNGTTYYYRVTAVDDEGNESSPSNEATATPSAFANWPEPEETSITLKIVSPEVDVSRVELQLGDLDSWETDSLSSTFATFTDPGTPAGRFSKVRLVDSSDQVVGYLPFVYRMSNFDNGNGVDAIIYVHDEPQLQPLFGRWSEEWAYYDEDCPGENGCPQARPLSMLVPPKGEVDSVDLNQQDPVVLVHGLSARYPAWGDEIGKVRRELVGHLSSEGYDGWQFYYPENQNITKSGPLLAKAVHRLQNDIGYGNDQSFDLVGHSMGGLVSRHYIQRMGIASSRSTYSQVLSFDPGEPGSTVNKFLMLGTPNHGSYRAWGCTGQGAICNNFGPIVFNRDVGAPAYRQMTPGSRFLRDLNRSTIAPNPYSQASTLVFAGTRNPLSEILVEIPDQDDGLVAVSSASLLDLGIPLAVGDFTHTSALDRGGEYDPRLNEDTDTIITNFLSEEYDPAAPGSLGPITGFWSGETGGEIDPEPSYTDSLSANPEEGVLTINAEETSIQNLGITSSCDTDGSSGIETCVRIGGGQGMKKVPSQTRFFSHIGGIPPSLGFGAALGLPAKAPRIATVQEHWFGEVGWQPVGKLSLPTKYLHTTQAHLELNDVQRTVAQASGFTPSVGVSSPSGNASATSSKSAAPKKTQTAGAQFQVDAETDTLSFWLAQDSTGDFSSHDMRLEAPDGTVIDSSEAKSEPGLRYTQDLALGYAIYSVIDPAPGRWTVRYNALVSASVAAPVMSTVDLRVGVPDSSFETGDTVPVTVSFSGQNTYEDTDVSAQLRVEDPEEGGMTTLGSIDLSESGPTTYEGEFSPSYVGAHQVAVDFSAKVGGKSVLRRTVESVTVSGDSADAAPEPPPPPTGLSAQREGAEGVALSWSAGGSGKTEEYRIYRDTIPNPTQQVASVPSGQTSYTDSEVRGGQVYYYRVAAVGTGGVESDPTDGASIFTYPSSLSINIQRPFGSVSSEQGYRLIALPGAADQPLQETLSGEAGNEWQAWWDDGSSQDYFQKFDGSDTFRFRAGRGFWALSKNDWSVSRSVETVPLSNEDQTSIPLHDGWNIIANPFGGDIGWGQVEAANEGTLRALWRFNGSFAQVDTFRSATAGEAFYFLNDTGLDSLNVPYPGAPAAKSQEKEKSPLLTIRARPKGAESPTSAVKVGFDKYAAKGLGRLDEPAPPGRFSSLSLRLQVPGEVPKRQRSLMIERRPLGSGPEEGQTFQLRLQAETDGPVQVMVSGLDAAEDSEMKLLRPSAGRSYDLATEEAITLEEADSTGLKLAVGSPAYVQNQAKKVLPDEVTLTSYPNPLRRQATVEYTLPEPTDVQVTVYDVLGRRVAILDEGRKQAGRHMVTLEGEKLPSGVYFGRLRAGGQTRTQKITVVR